MLNIPDRDLVLFEGASVTELHEDFAVAIDDYEESLRRVGREPAPG